MYRVSLSEPARKSFEEATAQLQKRFDRCFQILSRDPHRHPNIKRLKGQLKGYFRYRLGNYRIVYRVEDDARIVIVAVITHRGDAYR